MNAVHGFLHSALAHRGGFDGPDFAHARGDEDCANHLQEETVAGTFHRTDPAETDTDQDAHETFRPGFKNPNH
jgi:hypothetical protein